MALSEPEQLELVELQARGEKDDEQELATLARVALRLNYAIEHIEVQLIRLRRLVDGG